MKHTQIYNQINQLLLMIGQESINPIPECIDDKMQIDNLYTQYIDRFVVAFPQWEKYKNQPEMINDIGVQFLLGIRK